MDTRELKGVVAQWKDRLENTLDDYKERVGEWLQRVAVRKRHAQAFPPPEEGDRDEATRYLNRGIRHYNAKGYYKAERYFRRAVMADESFALAHYYRGLALYQLGAPDSAAKSWKRAAEVDPESEIAHKALRKIEYAARHRALEDDELSGTYRGRGKTS